MRNKDRKTKVLVANISRNTPELNSKKPLGKNQEAISTILNFRKEGKSIREIAELFGDYKTTIIRILHRNGLKYRENKLAVFGDTRTDGGYTKIFVGKGYAGAPKSGWMYLHRKIMQDKLGRVLLPSEVVLHLDHNKKNNAPENLKLLKRELQPVCVACPYYKFFLEHQRI